MSASLIEIVPAIDIIAGQCVRLSQGEYDSKKVYYEDPAEIALEFASLGIKRLHLVDLDGAKNSWPTNLAVLEKIASATNLEIQYGGGIKSEQSLRRVFDSGAKRAICGSIATSEPETLSSWLNKWGGDRIILGADVRGREVATHGWLKNSAVNLDELIGRFLPDGLSRVICTDISKDGMLEGPNFELYDSLRKQFPDLLITVSGGISSLDDIERLDGKGLDSVIVGKAIYEGRISFDDIARRNK